MVVDANTADTAELCGLCMQSDQNIVVLLFAHQRPSPVIITADRIREILSRDLFLMLGLAIFIIECRTGCHVQVQPCQRFLPRPRGQRIIFLCFDLVLHFQHVGGFVVVIHGYCLEVHPTARQIERFARIYRTVCVRI